MCEILLPERRALKKRQVIRIKRGTQEGGAGGRQGGGRRVVWARRAALISLHRLLPFVVSLFHCWDEGSPLPGCGVKWLRKGGEAASL